MFSHQSIAEKSCPFNTATTDPGRMGLRALAFPAFSQISGTIEISCILCYIVSGGIFMELRVLNYFLAIAREENFTRAAEQLHVTQPTLSRQIADLETELGVKLFVRSNHNITLTEDGMLLKRRAQEILSLADRTKRDFLHKAEKLEGTITIGSGEFLSTDVLADCVAAFREKYPLVRYELFSGNADNIKDGIERGLPDIG